MKFSRSATQSRTLMVVTEGHIEYNVLEGEGALSHQQLLLKLAPGGLPDSLLPGWPRLGPNAADWTPPLAGLGTASLGHDEGGFDKGPGTGSRRAVHRLKGCLQEGHQNKLKYCRLAECKTLQADHSSDWSISSRGKCLPISDQSHS